MPVDNSYDPIAMAVSDLIDVALGDQASLYAPNAEQAIVDAYMQEREAIVFDETDPERRAIRLSAMAARVGY